MNGGFSKSKIKSYIQNQSSSSNKDNANNVGKIKKNLY